MAEKRKKYAKEFKLKIVKISLTLGRVKDVAMNWNEFTLTIKHSFVK